MLHPFRQIVFCVLLFAAGACETSGQSMSVLIDASDLPRKLLSSTLEFPVDRDLLKDGTLALWYPKWVPGSHGPGGAVQNVAGLKIEDQSGNRLTWKRAPGEAYKIYVDVPVDVTDLRIQMRYISDQATVDSVGHDTFGSRKIGFISAGTVLMYPEGWSIDAAEARLQLKLPDGWDTATALYQLDDRDGVRSYRPATIRRYVDSPIMCGQFHSSYDLAEADTIPPHRLHIFSESESVLELPDAMVERMQSMVTQAALLFGSHPFKEFDILLATSDVLGRNGLEHSSSSFNVLGKQSFQDPDKLKGWDRLLVPHEYIHAWCGKYRRPAGMATTDFHTGKSTELLWVYEGLTQYLGELVEVRSGMMSPAEFRHRLEVEVRAAMLQQGRDWRTLADTAACSYILRAGSAYWPRLRRSQDYYMEGMLFWLEADALIRRGTDGEKSLDDFCRAFFAADNQSPHPNPFTRQDVVDSLNAVYDYNWDNLILRRIEIPVEQFDPALVELLGYSLHYAESKPEIPAKTFRRVSGIDALDSLGGVFNSDGTIKDLLLDYPLYKAGLGPGMKVLEVNGNEFSSDSLKNAIAKSPTNRQVELTVKFEEASESYTVVYDGGPRFLTLVRDTDEPDVLGEIVKPGRIRLPTEE